MVPPPTVPYPVGSAETMHLTVDRLTILLPPPPALSLPCPSSYGSGCWHLCHPTGAHGQVLHMEKPFLRYGKASPAIVPPQEGDLKPEDQERQLSWDCSVSKHLPHPSHLRLLLSCTVCSRRLSPSSLLSSSAKPRETDCGAGPCEGCGQETRRAE